MKLIIISITINDTTLAISLDAPIISPVTQPNVLSAMCARYNPVATAAIIAHAPGIPKMKYPITEFIINRINNILEFIPDLINLPIPLVSSLPITIDVIILNFDANSIMSTDGISISGGMDASAASVRDATTKNVAIPPVPTIESLITVNLFSGSPCTMSPSPMSITPSTWLNPVNHIINMYTSTAVSIADNPSTIWLIYASIAPIAPMHSPTYGHITTLLAMSSIPTYLLTGILVENEIIPSIPFMFGRTTVLVFSILFLPSYSILLLGVFL